MAKMRENARLRQSKQRDDVATFLQRLWRTKWAPIARYRQWRRRLWSIGHGPAMKIQVQHASDPHLFVQWLGPQL